MDVLHPRCAGLDVHKDGVVAAVRLAEPGGVRIEVRRFDTTTPGLLALDPVNVPLPLRLELARRREVLRRT